MTEWAKWSTGNCARDWSLTIRTNNICTTPNLSWRIGHTPLGFWDTNGSPNLNQTTRPYNNQQKGENLHNCGLAVPADHRVKLKESEKRDKYLDFARELKKTVEHESDDYTNCNWCSCTVTRGLVQGLGGLGNNRTGGVCPKLEYY